MRRVVDASAFIDAVLPTRYQGAALTALESHDLWAPSILDLEVTSVLWRLVRSSELTEEEADSALVALRTAPISRLANRALPEQAWTLRENVRISDAFYIVAARMLQGDLLTSDARLSRTPSLGVTVTLLR